MPFNRFYLRWLCAVLISLAFVLFLIAAASRSISPEPSADDGIHIVGPVPSDD
ncbi:MAG: hypothetical protein WAL34_04110 [Acidobacteriaceae bacterium]